MTTMDLKKLDIRPLRGGDYLSIVDIDTRTAGRPREGYIGSKFEHAVQTTGQMCTSYVAEYEGKVVGFIMGDVYVGEFGIPDDTATIDTIGVHPEWAGAGIARRLLGEFVTHCRGAGVTRIHTLVEWTAEPLLRFFDHMGFTPAKVLSLEMRL